jgi:hypothetical protein
MESIIAEGPAGGGRIDGVDADFVWIVGRIVADLVASAASSADDEKGSG